MSSKSFQVTLLSLVMGFSAMQASAQVKAMPSAEHRGSFLILGAVAHLGNGERIDNSAIAVVDGRFSLVADATLIKLDLNQYDTIYQGEGLHAYPGFIAAVSGIGLREIAAVRATDDHSEVGDFTPHVRSAIAYNTDSRVIPTLRNNGILIAQVIPQGGTIPGTSSVLHLDGWNWQDALLVEDDALHINWPALYKGPDWWSDNPRIKKNEDYDQQSAAIYAYLDEARAYARNPSPAAQNLAFDAMRPVFEKGRKVFIRCGFAREIAEVIAFAEHFELDYVLVNAHEVWQVVDLLQRYKVPVILESMHRLPSHGHSDIDQPFKTPAVLAEAGIKFGLSMGAGWDAFWNFRNLPYQAGTASAYGLDAEEAIAAISGNLAEILGIADRCGTLSPGKDASFFLSGGDMLEMYDSEPVQAWIKGGEMDLDDMQRQWYRLYMSKYGLSE